MNKNALVKRIIILGITLPLLFTDSRLTNSQENTVELIYNGVITDAAWSPDGELLALQGSNGIDIYDKNLQKQGNIDALMSWSEIENIDTSVLEVTDVVQSLAWSPDSTYIISGEINLSRSTTFLAIWNAETYELENTISLGPTSTIRTIEWNSNINQIAVVAELYSDIKGIIWEIFILGSKDGSYTNYEYLRSFGNERFPILSVTWHPSEDIIASANADGQIQTWDTATGLLLDTYEGHIDAVNDVLWSQDGKKLYSAGKDGRLIVWDVNSFTPSYLFQPHGAYAINDLEWNPEFTYMVSSGDDQTIYLWNLLGNEFNSVNTSTNIRKLSWNYTSEKVVAVAISSVYVLDINFLLE